MNSGLFVESPGIEPGSKQATKGLSTRLFSVWIFDLLVWTETTTKGLALLFQCGFKT